MGKLRELAGMNNTDAEDSELDSLTKEAEMPINELLSKLKEVGQTPCLEHLMYNWKIK